MTSLRETPSSRPVWQSDLLKYGPPDNCVLNGDVDDTEVGTESKLQQDQDSHIKDEYRGKGGLASARYYDLQQESANIPVPYHVSLVQKSRRGQ